MEENAIVNGNLGNVIFANKYNAHFIGLWENS